MKLTFTPNRKQIRTALILLAIAAVVGGGLYYILSKNNNANEGLGRPGGPGGFGKGGGRPQPVAASPVKVQDVPIWINAIGTMVPKNLVTVRSRTDGELLKLHFQEGQLVKAGQLLAELDPRAAQVQLTQANGQLARDTALLKNAQLDLERYRSLLEKDSISKQQVDTQEALVRQYQGTAEVDRGAGAAAQLQLAYTRITAPVSGRIGLRQVDPGNIVKASDANGIVVIAQVQPIMAVFSVPEINLPAVTEALNAKEAVVVEVWDREQKKKLATGKLLTADNQIDTATGTLKIKAEFANTANTLFPNQFVNVKLSAGIVRDAQVVPGSAVLRGAKGNYVYLIEGDTVSAVPVKMGPVNGDEVVVEGKLPAGAQVVTDGADKLRDGAKVSVVSAEARNKATSDEGKGKGKRKKPEGAAAATETPAASGAAASNAPADPASAPAAPAGKPAAAPSSAPPEGRPAGGPPA